MSEFEGLDGIVGMQVSHMLEGISNDLELRRKEILDKAGEDAAALARRIRSRNLNHLRSAIAEERRMAELAVQKERASQATVVRQFSHGRDRERLVQGREMLREALQERWREEHSRKQWIATLVGEVADVFAQGRWLVEHPQDLAGDDLESLVSAATDISGSSPELVANEELKVGLRITLAGAVLDASLDGLLAHQEAIEGLLLAQILELVEGRETGENSGD